MKLTKGEIQNRFINDLKEDLLQKSSWNIRDVDYCKLEYMYTDAGRVHKKVKVFTVNLVNDFIDGIEFSVTFELGRWRDIELYNQSKNENMSDSYYLEIIDDITGGYWTEELLQYTPKEYGEICDLESIDDFKYYSGIYDHMMDYIANRIFNIERIYYYGKEHNNNN